MKDEPDLLLENEFYSAAMRVIQENSLIRVLEDYGFLSLGSIVKYLDSETASKYEAIEGIRGSTAFLQ